MKILVSTEIDQKVKTQWGLKRNLKLQLETTVKLLRSAQGQLKYMMDCFFFLRFYLFIHERHTHTHTEGGGQRHRQREKQVPCKEPDMGLDPGTPESQPGLKVGTKPLSHLGTPSLRSSM